MVATVERNCLPKTCSCSPVSCGPSCGSKSCSSSRNRGSIDHSSRLRQQCINYCKNPASGCKRSEEDSRLQSEDRTILGFEDLDCSGKKRYALCIRNAEERDDGDEMPHPQQWNYLHEDKEAEIKISTRGRVSAKDGEPISSTAVRVPNCVPDGSSLCPSVLEDGSCFTVPLEQFGDEGQRPLLVEKSLARLVSCPGMNKEPGSASGRRGMTRGMSSMSTSGLVNNCGPSPSKMVNSKMQKSASCRSVMMPQSCQSTVGKHDNGTLNDIMDTAPTTNKRECDINFLSENPSWASPSSPLQLSMEGPTPVWLNFYEMQDTLSSWLQLGKSIDPRLLHVGLEFGKARYSASRYECFYSGVQDPDPTTQKPVSGLFLRHGSQIRKNDEKYHESLYVGLSPLSEFEILQQKLRPAASEKFVCKIPELSSWPVTGPWRGERYRILTHNCQSFVNYFLRILFPDVISSDDAMAAAEIMKTGRGPESRLEICREPERCSLDDYLYEKSWRGKTMLALGGEWGNTGSNNGGVTTNTNMAIRLADLIEEEDERHPRARNLNHANGGLNGGGLEKNLKKAKKGIVSRMNDDDFSFKMRKAAHVGDERDVDVHAGTEIAYREEGMKNAEDNTWTPPEHNNGLCEPCTRKVES